jgi:hypothetical protein
MIRGTPAAVTVIVGSLAGGMTFDEIQREYDVTVDDVRAAPKSVAEPAEASGVEFEVAREVEVQRTGPATPNPDEESGPAEQPVDAECGPDRREAADYPH